MWQLLKVARNTSLSSSSGSELIHLPRANQIGMIYLTVRATNGATSNNADEAEQQTIEESLTRIEVSSGGEVFKKYNGINCRNIATYNTGRLPPEKRNQNAGAVQESLFPIYFNTQLSDRSVILPAPEFTTLDLEFDYAFTEHADAGFAAAGFYYDIYMWVLPPDGDMANKNIIVTREKDSYTTATAGEKTFDLTVDPNRYLSRVYVDCYEHAIAEGVNITDLELQVNSDRMHLCKWTDLQMINAMDCNLEWKKHVMALANSTTDKFYTRIPNLRRHSYQSYDGTDRDDTEYINAITAGDITMVNTDLTTGSWDFTSDVIPAFVVLDLDRDGSGMGLLSQNLKNLELILTDAASGGAVKIMEESITKKWF